jgi:hypothetical protein
MPFSHASAISSAIIDYFRYCSQLIFAISPSLIGQFSLAAIDIAAEILIELRH